MKFAKGSSRFVILIGGIAIKFPIIRFLWAARRLIENIFLRQVEEKLKRFDQTSLVLGGMKYLFHGVRANCAEVRIWNSTELKGIAPTYLSFFGLVNIQRRGQAVSKQELAEEHPFPHLRRIKVLQFDLEKEANFCRIDGCVVMVDCGKPELERYLLKLANHKRRGSLVAHS